MRRAAIARRRQQRLGRGTFVRLLAEVSTEIGLAPLRATAEGTRTIARGDTARPSSGALSMSLRGRHGTELRQD